MNTIILEEKLNAEETTKFITDTFPDGQFNTTGTFISKIMPPTSRFGKSNRSQKKQIIIEKLKSFFDKYSDLEIYDLKIKTIH